MCAELPRIELPMEFMFVQHGVEYERPTNTGRIAHFMLPNSRLIHYATDAVPFDAAPLMQSDTEYHLLFPREGATELSLETLNDDSKKTQALVILDATWSRASRMSRRIDALQTTPCVKLPETRPGQWIIRRPSKSYQLCTLETAIRVVELMGRKEEAEAMLDGMKLVMSRMLYIRGMLTDLLTMEQIKDDTFWQRCVDARFKKQRKDA